MYICVYMFIYTYIHIYIYTYIHMCKRFQFPTGEGCFNQTLDTAPGDGRGTSRGRDLIASAAGGHTHIYLHIRIYIYIHVFICVWPPAALAMRSLPRTLPRPSPGAVSRLHLKQ